MSRFAGLKKNAAPEAPVKPSINDEVATSPSAQFVAPAPTGPKNPREGKKAVVGYFSKEVSRGLHLLALDNEASIQGLLGEAIDDLMRKYGKHPFGER